MGSLSLLPGCSNWRLIGRNASATSNDSEDPNVYGPLRTSDSWISPLATELPPGFPSDGEAAQCLLSASQGDTAAVPWGTVAAVSLRQGAARCTNTLAAEHDVSQQQRCRFHLDGDSTLHHPTTSSLLTLSPHEEDCNPFGSAAATTRVPAGAPIQDDCTGAFTDHHRPYRHHYLYQFADKPSQHRCAAAPAAGNLTAASTCDALDQQPLRKRPRRASAPSVCQQFAPLPPPETNNPPPYDSCFPFHQSCCGSGDSTRTNSCCSNNMDMPPLRFHHHDDVATATNAGCVTPTTFSPEYYYLHALHQDSTSTTTLTPKEEEDSTPYGNTHILGPYYGDPAFAVDYAGPWTVSTGPPPLPPSRNIMTVIDPTYYSVGMPPSAAGSPPRSLQPPPQQQQQATCGAITPPPTSPATGREARKRSSAADHHSSKRTGQSDVPGVYFDQRKRGFRVRFQNVYVGWVSLSRYPTYEEAYRVARKIWDDAVREATKHQDKQAAVNAGIPLQIQSRLKPKNPGGRPRTVSRLAPLVDAKISAAVQNAKLDFTSRALLHVT